MYYETNCTQLSLQELQSLMKNARRCSYQRLVARIRRNLPDFYYQLALEFPNPYADKCRQTKSHYILVHSAIEYFIHK